MMLLPTIASSVRRRHRLLTSSPCCRHARSFASNGQPPQMDEGQHIGKQLSRPSENAKLNHTKWSNIAQTKFPTTLTSAAAPVGLEHYCFSAYEHAGLSEIHARSFDANVLLEVRDVRVPASSHHPSFTRLAKHRMHLICYTHADLIDAPTRDRVAEWTGRVWPKALCVFVDTRADGQTQSGALNRFDGLYHNLLQVIEDRGGINTALTVGIPNVGKSSVLQSLLRNARQNGAVPKKIQVKARGFKEQRKKKGGKGSKALRNGGMPGVIDTPGKTREITEYMLREKPRAYFMDVPGITPPQAFFEERPYAWLGCGAANLLPLGRPAAEDVTTQRSFCKYVLTCANRDGVFHYVDKLGLDGPTANINEALEKLGNGIRYQKLPDEARWLKRCELFLKLYNTGNLGPLVLDDMSDRKFRPFVFQDKHFERRDNRYSKGPRGGDEFAERAAPRGNDRHGQPLRRPEGGARSSGGPRREQRGNEHYSQRPSRGDGIRAGRRNDDRSNDDDEWFRTP